MSALFRVRARPARVLSSSSTSSIARTIASSPNVAAARQRRTASSSIPLPSLSSSRTRLPLWTGTGQTYKGGRTTVVRGLATVSDAAAAANTTSTSTTSPPPSSPPLSPKDNPLLSSHSVNLPQQPIMPSSYHSFPPCPPIPQVPAGQQVDLVLPPTEDRPHRYFVLPNGLEVVVVSDVNADKSAASMDVGVGHLSDPSDLPGCAHFCEHLLFMGTKKYPKENEYQTYLTSHNGHSNAYTAMTSTVYFFDVAQDALEGALDRFAGFFIEPLFNEDCTEREIKAVDSEHKKNLQNDMWRFFQLEKHNLRSDHAYHKFGTGSYDTLWSTPKEAGRDPRQQLISWWEKYYCARRMKLAVVGKEDVETLEKWVRERFERVPVRSEGLPEVGEEGVRIAFTESPVGEEQMGSIIFCKPVQDTRGLEVTFPVPDLDHLYQSKPLNFLIHFLGHEGRGSILSYLKNQGWVNYLRAGCQHGAAGFDFLKVTVDLTPEGLEHYEDVALAFYKYMALLRSSPPSAAAFDEIKQISNISFRFAEKTKPMSYAQTLSSHMQHPAPRDKIVSHTWLLEDFNQKDLSAALQLLDPRRAVVGVTAKELPKGVEGTFDRTEPIYGTEYKMMKLSDKFIDEAMNGTPIPELALPGPNAFIPEKLDVEKFDVELPALRPTLLRDTQLSRLWWKRDDRFWLPKANVFSIIHTPIINATPRNSVLARLWLDLYQDSITEDIYDADMAELSFHPGVHGEYFSIGAFGFSDKLPVLVETMVAKMVGLEVDKGRFDAHVDALKLSWKNFPLQDPYRQIGFWTSFATSMRSWTPEERLAEIDDITPEDVKAFGKEALRRASIETLVHGDTTLEKAKDLQDMLERTLGCRPLAAEEKQSMDRRSLIIPPKSEHVWSMPVPNKAEVNNAVIYTLHIGDELDKRSRNILAFFAQIAKEPTFDTLRTKEQLGYICQSSWHSSNGPMYFRILVQSERDPVYVENRIEAFLEGLEKIIEETTDEEFEKHRQSLIAEKEEKPKNLGEETRRFWGRISDGYYEFSKRQNDVAELRQVTKADVLDLFRSKISIRSSDRAKLSTHMRSQYKGIKFDAASAQPLVEAFTKHGVAVDQAAMQQLIASKPDLQAVKDFASAAVAKAESLAEEARTELSGMIEGLKGVDSSAKGDGEEQAKLREGNIMIDDIYRFKAGMVPSKAPVPIEPLSIYAKM